MSEEVKLPDLDSIMAMVGGIKYTHAAAVSEGKRMIRGAIEDVLRTYGEACAAASRAQMREDALSLFEDRGCSLSSPPAQFVGIEDVRNAIRSLP